MTSSNKEFYKKVFTLVLPMALQNLINVGVTAADVIMLGKVGETVLSGASLAGQLQWIMNLMFFGICSGASVLAAQYWGKKDLDAIERIIGISLKYALGVSVIFTLIALLIPRQVLMLFTTEEAVIMEGMRYLRIICFSYILTAITMVYLNIIRSIEKVVISTVVYSLSLITNIILNYTLIYGNFGMPALGIRGAAIATLVARTLEVSIVFFYAFRINKDLRMHVGNIFKKDALLGADFRKYAFPVILNEIMWGAGYSANTAIIGHLGSSAVAANSVAHTIRQLSMVVAFGVANSAAVMIGKSIGEKKEEDAREYAAKFTRLCIYTGVAGMILILAISPFTVKYMGMGDGTSNLMSYFLFVMSVYVIGQAINSTMVVGIFRSGGDTKFGLILDITTMWGCSILLGAVAAFVFHFPVKIVYLFIMSDEIIKIPICMWRYRSKKWLNNVTR